MPGAVTRNGSVIAAVMAALALSGCASAPASSRTADKGLPTGWVRYSYGALSVGAPSAWKLSSAPLQNCFPPPQHTITETTMSKFSPSACGASSADSPVVEAVVIECLRSEVSRLYSGPAVTTRVRGTTLYRRNELVYLPGDGWESVVSLPDGFASSDLGQQILQTVVPTGKPC